MRERVIMREKRKTETRRGARNMERNGDKERA